MRPGWKRRLAAVLFPERCAACGRVVLCGEGFCTACREALPRMEPPVCPLCGREKAKCRCGKRTMAYNRCVMPFAYQGAAAEGIRRLKHEGRAYAAEAFAGEMEKVVRRELADAAFTCVIPVPLSRKSEKSRGYNQAALLARPLARGLGLSYREDLVKLTDTRPQKELSALERSGNLLGAFDVREGAAVEGEAVLLVDDVTTTGATLHECAKMLKLYGAREVWAVTAAGTLPDNEERQKADG